MAETLSPVQSSVYFLERSERWKTEKPYVLDYVPELPAVRSNSSLESKNIDVEDIRGRETEFTYSKNGFFVLPLDCSMTPEDYDDDAKVKQIYLKQVGDSVKEALGASRVQIYDYIVRKREATFPISTGKFYSHKQPSSIAHVDTTPPYMEEMLNTLNPDDAESLRQGRYQSVNIWKPLRGPLRDWPLTLCDPTTVDPTDLQSRDTVRRDSFIETFQVHWSPAQRWYYLSDQMPNEAWVFLQGNGAPNAMLGVPHTAFDNPLASTSDIPRESIEVRSLVFYDE